MANSINTNLSAIIAGKYLSQNNAKVQQSIVRLSSGSRISSASDDAAGLAISKNMESTIRSLDKAAGNAADGISLSQTAEGAIGNISEILTRMNELSIQGSSATFSASNRANLGNELNQLLQQVDQIAGSTTFNGINLLSGTFISQNFQVGATSSDTISLTISSAKTGALGNNRLNQVNATANQGTSSVTTITTNAPSSNAIGAQTLSVSGSLGSASVSVAAGDSAFTIANSINDNTSSTGVTASAYTEAQIGSLSNDGTITLTLGSGSGTSTISAAVTTTDMSALATAINAKTGNTGVSATFSGGTLNLIQADGKDIHITDFSHSDTSTDQSAYIRTVRHSDTNGDGIDDTSYGTKSTLTNDSGTPAASLNNTTVAGSIYYDSTNSFSIKSSVTAGAGSVLNGNTAQGSTLEVLSNITFSSVSTSKQALRVISAALTKMNDSRADLGAFQNRLSYVTDSINTTQQNLAAANSRIKDTDFAAETTNLAKFKILAQAATAMVTQANQQPQSVLSLLQ